MGKEKNREGLKLDMLMEDKKEEGRIAKKERKKLGNTSFHYGRTKKKKKKKETKETKGNRKRWI